METTLEQIKAAIVRRDIKVARELLIEELRSNPSAEAYYLGAQVSLNDIQKREFLEKAVALDPFHARAYQELNGLRVESGLQVAGATYASGGRRFVAYVIDNFLVSVCSRFLFSCAPNYSPSLRRVTTRKICCLLRDTVPNPRASQVYFCFRDLNARGEGPVPLLFAEARVHLPGVCEGCKRK